MSHTLTISDAAHALKVSTKTIRRRINDGTLPAFDIAPAGSARAQLRINPQDLNKVGRPFPAYGYNPKGQLFTTKAAA